MKIKKELIIFLLLVIPGFVFCADDEKQTSFGGFWAFNYMALIGNDYENVPYYDTYSNLRVKMHTDISDNIYVEISGDFRIYGDSNIFTLDDLADPSSTYTTDAMIWEAYVDIIDFGIEGLDVRIGKQRIAWGTADKMNQTDWLNPDDLANFFDFGEHIPTMAIRADYNISTDLILEFIWVPSMRTALLPKDPTILMGGEMSSIYTSVLSQSPDLAGATISDTQIIVNIPDYNLSNSMEAVKLKGMIGAIDFSISWFHGYEDLPTLTSIDFTYNEDDPSVIDLTVNTGFFEFNAIGLDAAGELAGMGWWAEAALTFPAEEQQIVITAPDSSSPSGVATYTTLLWDTDPWFKATLGFDYTFSGGFYVNFQYVHGLFNEYGEPESINDYFLGKIEKKFAYDKLKIGLAGAYSITNWDDIENNYGALINPEIEWIPYESLSIKLGSYIIDSSGSSFFSSIDMLDMIYLKAKIDF